jgi:hypothetical protein
MFRRRGDSENTAPIYADALREARAIAALVCGISNPLLKPFESFEAERLRLIAELPESASYQGLFY